MNTASIAIEAVRRIDQLFAIERWITGKPPDEWVAVIALGCDDIVIVQINPVVRKGTPKTAREIQNRVNEITFNSSLMKELRSINFVDRLIDEGKLSRNEYRRLNVHIIEATDEMNPLGASSKVNSEWAFLMHLKDIGRRAATRWITNHFEMIGVSSTVDLQAMFGEIGIARRC